MGISPGGARESSPWREPWEQTRTARSPGGAKEPFHGDSPIAGHEGPSYAPTGLARLWAVPTGLTPWAWSFYICSGGGTADELFFRQFDLEFFQEFGVFVLFLA